MKKFLFLSVLICLFIFLDSCKDNPAADPENQINWPAGTVTIDDKLPNWTYGSGYSLILFVCPSVKDSYAKTVLDSCAIGSDGSFNIHLPPLADNYYDDTVSFYNIYCFDSVVINPSGLKTANTVFEIHKDGYIKGAVQKKIHNVGNENIGTYYVTYKSFSEYGLMRGTYQCYYWTGTEFDTVLANVNENVNKGWNPIVSTIMFKSIQKMIYNYSCTDPGLSTEWVYYMNKDN